MDDPNGTRPWAQAALYLALMVTILDLTIVNVALPTILRDLGGSNTDGQWIVDSYTLVVAGFVLLGAGLGDRLGRKLIFLCGIGVFLVGSVIAAFAPGVLTLIAGRAIMGLGAAAMLPSTLSLISALFSPEVRPTIIARWATASGIALASGPVLGGLLVASFWWGSVFLVTAPVVALAGLIGWRAIPESRVPDEGPLDLKGAALSVIALGAIVGGLIEGPRFGWTSPEILGALILGLVALAAFVRVEHRCPQPMFDLSVLKIPALQGGASAMFFGQMLFFATMLLVPQYLTFVEKHPAGDVGLLLAIPAVVFSLTMARTSALCRRFGDKPMLITAALILSAGCLVLGFSSAPGHTKLALVAMSLAFVGIGILMTPGTSVMMNAVDLDHAGSASAANQVARQVGAALGVAIIGSLFASVYGSAITRALSDSSLPADALAKATQSPANAEDVAATLASTAAQSVDAAVITAFGSAFQMSMFVCAGIALATAAIIVNRVPAAPKAED